MAAFLIETDIDNPDALRRYYDLLLSVIRVIVSAVFSRGVHNEQIKAQTRAFIAENRPCMVGVFKRFAKIGGDPAASHQDTLCELVKSFMALVAATDFLEVSFPADLPFCTSANLSSVRGRGHAAKRTTYIIFIGSRSIFGLTFNVHGRI